MTSASGVKRRFSASMAKAAPQLSLETRVNGLQIEVDDLWRFVKMELEAARRRDDQIKTLIREAAKK
jgi:uncharacterized protein YneR